ncbi:VCBS repeat-containing protein [Shimia sp. R11_0]|uniref:FG-GAP repeat domain-containing protein n=1 Tax=Shimia sp. R11_0 TaxID=2821096 RepID=UPI001AD9BB9D|nr:VCBS repeat-containing protein [Shimia sp. R11_0]MBO9478126.1 VCBS repeat-containing protein [Shimia sp. R11_0]
MRRAWPVLCAGLMVAGAPATAEITAARYQQETTRYAHGVLGDAIEYGALELTLQNGQRLLITLPQERVFEDIAPRLFDMDGDGAPEVIVVESSQSAGARLAIYDAKGLRAATPYIGQRNRWLAPIGAADLDSDGAVEIAYIDRPHLAKTLRVWRFQDDQLTEVARLTGLTNHRIGEDFISGGIRDCGQGPEMITADGAWRSVVATRFDGTGLSSETLGPFTGQAAFAAALTCASR